MPRHQHAPRPDDDGPPPSRWDPRSPAAGDRPCDCGGCREFRAIHAGFCAEVPAEQREIQREIDRAAQHRYSDRHTFRQAS